MFLMLLGFLGGMSVMHLLVVLYINEKEAFLAMYSPVSVFINFLFLLLANITLLFGMAVASIFRQMADEKIRRLDLDR